nr:hypothetical protein [Achromobacter ruhlandii]
MALFPAPDPHSQRFDLPSGASRQLRLRGGATVICVSGRVLVAEPAYRSELPPGTYLPPPTRLHAGESFFLPERGTLTVTALGKAQLICLQAPGAKAWILAFARCLRRLVGKNNQPNGLGALHNISK